MVFRKLKECQCRVWMCQLSVRTRIAYKIVSNDLCDLCTSPRPLGTWLAPSPRARLPRSARGRSSPRRRHTLASLARTPAPGVALKYTDMCETSLEDKFATDSDCANAARGYTDTSSKKELLDCIEFRGMGRNSMGGLQNTGTLQSIDSLYIHYRRDT